MDNRYNELDEVERIIIDRLINSIASHSNDTDEIGMNLASAMTWAAARAAMKVAHKPGVNVKESA